ncbi:methyl-accepting chemotaxis protein [Novosphingobium sp.]|uniref:methyl-accepting chemotaxis protein n=1 Tax=Novosphingobium sp. TaxID=1874826 RepID=UPI0026313838|nr:HAMP domain-containing methyl-accepting chemotaxis protein [Novosphingobium sp.]
MIRGLTMNTTGSISAGARKLGILLFATFAIAVTLTALALSQVRLGGNLDQQNRVTSEFIADVLPPTLYLVEPMLQSTLIASDPEGIAEREQELGKLETGYHERLKFWRDSTLDPALRAQIDQRLVPLGQRFWKQVHDGLIPAGRTGDLVQINMAHDALEDIYAEHRKEIDAVVGAANAHNANLQQSSGAISTWSMWGLLVLALGLTAQMVWTQRLLRRHVLAPLGETAETMTRMADGDLEAGRTDLHRGDEIGAMTRAIEVFRASAARQVADAGAQRTVVDALSGALGELADGRLDSAIHQPFASDYEPLRQAFNTTVARLGELIRDVSTSARGVSNGASEILSASDDLASRNERQAGSVEETAAAMRQVTLSIADTAQKTAEVRETMRSTHSEVTAGGETVQRTVAAMSEIESSSREINQIISVIEGIAFQTNLLALNAGVEAARAGDAGKGFAVVANEVRALAQRSSDAAHEISALIGKSTGRVSEGVTLVAETGALLTRMVERIAGINEQIGEISVAAQQQATNLEQVNGSVSDMDRVTQQNAAMVEETTAAARSLAQEADRMAGLVARFSAAGGEPPRSERQRPAPVARMAAPRPAVAAPAPRFDGALALAPASAGDSDWAEF